MLKYIVLIVFFGYSCLKAQTFTPLIENIPASFRGLDTYKNNVVWVSGSKGTVGYSNDSGQTWNWVNPKGYEHLDFRDITVFSNKEAVIVSAGTPAVVLRTTNAGKTWNEVYKDARPEIFLDAMDFNGKTGFILGDPIDGSFQLLKSTNKGKTWTDVSKDFMLFADEGEAAFAASGSNIQVFKDFVYIGTGGLFSGFFYYSPKNLRIDKYECPIWYGNSSSGVFAIDFIDEQTGIVVGGNYEMDQDNRNNVLLTYDGGKNWEKPQTPVSGYRSDVQYIDKNTLIATGTSGTDISYDAGKNWSNISKESFNTLGKTANGKTIFLTGSNGNVYKLEIE